MCSNGFLQGRGKGGRRSRTARAFQLLFRLMRWCRKSRSCPPSPVGRQSYPLSPTLCCGQVVTHINTCITEETSFSLNRSVHREYCHEKLENQTHQVGMLKPSISVFIKCVRKSLLCEEKRVSCSFLHP